MKNLIFLLVFSISIFTSCQKEETAPAPEYGFFGTYISEDGTTVTVSRGEGDLILFESDEFRFYTIVEQGRSQFTVVKPEQMKVFDGKCFNLTRCVGMTGWINSCAGGIRTCQDILYIELTAIVSADANVTITFDGIKKK